MNEVKNYIAAAIFLCPDNCINIVAVGCMIMVSACAGSLAGAIATTAVGLATIVYNAKVIHKSICDVDSIEMS